MFLCRHFSIAYELINHITVIKHLNLNSTIAAANFYSFEILVIFNRTV